MSTQTHDPNPLLLIAELSYACPLHCPYCSNPLSIRGERYRHELRAAEWRRVFEEAAALGVLQVALTGGEPLVRRDAEELVRSAAAAGLYTTLVTGGTPFTASRATALRGAGLDHVQISIQDSDPVESDRIAGAPAFAKKIDAAKRARELGLPLTINVVLHRFNLDRIDAIVGLAEQLGARKLELANVQYQGWAALNVQALLPDREQLDSAERAVAAARERLGSTLEILWVLPDYYEEFPKPCMGGWGRVAIVVAPNGDVLPCQAAATIPELTFDNIRDARLDEIWFESEAFRRFRGTDWMPEPCQSCPFERQELDFGGCRCQALALTGDAAQADPVCHLSPHHGHVVRARTVARRSSPRSLTYRTTTPGVPIDLSSQEA